MRKPRTERLNSIDSIDSNDSNNFYTPLMSPREGEITYSQDESWLHMKWNFEGGILLGLRNAYNSMRFTQNISQESRSTPIADTVNAYAVPNAVFIEDAGAVEEEKGAYQPPPFVVHAIPVVSIQQDQHFYNINQVPDAYVDPLTGQIMLYPVDLPNDRGHVEKETYWYLMEASVRHGPQLCPYTREQLTFPEDHGDSAPPVNHRIKNLIHDHIARNPESEAYLHEKYDQIHKPEWPVLQEKYERRALDTLHIFGQKAEALRVERLAPIRLAEELAEQEAQQRRLQDEAEEQRLRDQEDARRRMEIICSTALCTGVIGALGVVLYFCISSAPCIHQALDSFSPEFESLKGNAGSKTWIYSFSGSQDPDDIICTVKPNEGVAPNKSLHFHKKVIESLTCTYTFTGELSNGINLHLTARGMTTNGKGPTGCKGRIVQAKNPNPHWYPMCSYSFYLDCDGRRLRGDLQDTKGFELSNLVRWDGQWFASSFPLFKSIAEQPALLNNVNKVLINAVRTGQALFSMARKNEQLLRLDDKKDVENTVENTVEKSFVP